jgi:hypothetical protein
MVTIMSRLMVATTITTDGNSRTIIKTTSLPMRVEAPAVYWPRPPLWYVNLFESIG